MYSLNQESCRISEIIKKSFIIKDGNPVRCWLKTSTDNLHKSEPYRKRTFGERDKIKPHKTILMLGETGSGKTTLINTMVNYMLGVKREDKVWFEITDDQSDRTSVYTQTSIVTVYGFYLQESPIGLTIIDTPGYGNTHGTDHDKKIAMSLLSLSESPEVIHEIDAVCLVIDASQTRLSENLINISGAVQVLFERDIAENIVLLLAHSSGTQPKNALTAVKEAKIKCAVNDKNQPVFFLFNNRQSDAADEEYDEEHEIIQENSWKLSLKGMLGFFQYLDTIKPKPLRMSQVLYQKKFKTNISNLQQCVRRIEQKQEELKQAPKQHEEDVRSNKNVENEAEVPNKEEVDIDPAVAKTTVFEENCPHPDSSLKMRNPLKDEHCKVCTNKCDNSKHNKEAKICVPMTKKEMRICVDLKKEYDGKIGNSVSLVKKLEEELQELEKDKIKHAFDAFYCVEILQIITHNIDSLITPYIDFLIEKLNELNEPKKVETLENIKRAGR